MVNHKAPSGPAVISLADVARGTGAVRASMTAVPGLYCQHSFFFPGVLVHHVVTVSFWHDVALHSRLRLSARPASPPDGPLPRDEQCKPHIPSRERQDSGYSAPSLLPGAPGQSTNDER
jgi:hypothetical protein